MDFVLKGRECVCIFPRFTQPRKDIHLVFRVESSSEMLEECGNWYHDRRYLTMLLTGSSPFGKTAARTYHKVTPTKMAWPNVPSARLHDNSVIYIYLKPKLLSSRHDCLCVLSTLALVATATSGPNPLRNLLQTRRPLRFIPLRSWIASDTSSYSKRSPISSAIRLRSVCIVSNWSSASPAITSVLGKSLKLGLGMSNEDDEI